MKVWRYENERGVGPYQESQWYGKMDLTFARAVRIILNGHGAWDDDRHPVYYLDGIEGVAGVHGWRAAFSSMAQLEEWFEPQLREFLPRVGWHLATYEVPDEYVKVGGHQVAFQKRYAKRIPVEE